MNLDHYFAHVLQITRRDKCITQANLAIKADLDASYISELERGKSQPSLETILKLAKALEVNAAEMVDLVEKQAHRR